MATLKKYLSIITFILGSLGGGVLTGVTMGSTALANIKENKADILECKEDIKGCRDNHQEIMLAINSIENNGNKLEALLIDLFRKLGHDHSEYE